MGLLRVDSCVLLTCLLLFWELPCFLVPQDYLGSSCPSPGINHFSKETSSFLPSPKTKKETNKPEEVFTQHPVLGFQLLFTGLPWGLVLLSTWGQPFWCDVLLHSIPLSDFGLGRPIPRHKLSWEIANEPIALCPKFPSELWIFFPVALGVS